MSTVDMRHVNFWLPPDFRPNSQRTTSHHRGPAAAPTSQKQAVPLCNKAGRRPQNSSKSKAKSKSKSGVVTDRHGFATRATDDSTAPQGCDYDSASGSDDDTLPPLEEALRNAKLRDNVQGSLQHLNDSGVDPSGSSQTKLRLGNSNDDNQGTRDSPVILDDDEMNNSSIEAAAIPASADAGIEPITDPKKPTSSINHEAWYDVEDGCYVFEDPLPLEKDGLTPTVGQDNEPSLGVVAQDASSQHSDGNAHCTPQEPGSEGFPQLRRTDGEDDCGEGVSDFEKDMLKAFKGQEDLSPPNTSIPPHSHRPSREPACLQEDRERDQSAPEVLRDASPLGTPSQDKAVIPISLEEQQQDTVVDDAREAGDDTSKPERAQAAEKLMREGGPANTGCHTEPLKSKASSEITNCEEDEEDEEPRPAKRRKRSSQLARQTPVHFEQHPPQSSRSPSARRDLVTFAEYQEWPFQGFLKRTRIGNETTYNLEFKLPCMSELISLPIEACDDEDVPATHTTRPKAPTSKLSTPTSRTRTRVKWMPKDDAKLVDMKKRGCSWKEINAAFPDRTPGTIQVRCSTKLRSRLA